MNELFIIGNLTRDPVKRVTPQGVTVCNFTVAVNRHRGAQQGVDFFNVTAWRELGELCAKYLSTGRKVGVLGSVSCTTYAGRDGTTRASMYVEADRVEFLTPKDQKEQQEPQQEQAKADGGFVEVTGEELPF